MINWTATHNPHIGAGGPDDGKIVSYNGSKRFPQGFNYRMPGLFSSLPMYLDVVAMVKITAEQANAIGRARYEIMEREWKAKDDAEQ